MNKEQTRKMFLKVIDKQIADNNPPETKQTLDRLIAEGIPQSDAKNLIGCVVISEMFNVLKNKQEFDLNRYIKVLNKLPQLPE